MSDPDNADLAKQIQDKYVRLPDEYVVHLVDGDETACGIDIEGEYQTGNNAGVVDRCEDCLLERPDMMTVKDIVESLDEDIPGFNNTGKPYGYLNKEQLRALVQYIVDMEHQIEELEDERADLAEHREALEEEEVERRAE